MMNLTNREHKQLNILSKQHVFKKQVTDIRRSLDFTPINACLEGIQP
jgi:hypothetical protein